MMRSAADWLSQSGTSSPSLVITDAVYKLIKGAGGLSQPSKSEAGLQACNPGLVTLLATLLATLQGRISGEALRDGIRRLCRWAPLSGDQLATLLGKDRDYLRNKHLIPMVRDGQLRFRYPESAKHPHQAYVAPEGEDKSND